MRIYFKYFLQVLKHKSEIFKQCLRDGMFIHGFTHDLSKFTLSEFIPSARWYYGEYGYKMHNENEKIVDIRHLKIKKQFEKANLLHNRRNKHHIKHWEGKKIPKSYLYEIACEIKVTARLLKITTEEYFHSSNEIQKLSTESKNLLKIYLGIEKIEVIDC